MKTNKKVSFSFSILVMLVGVLNAQHIEVSGRDSFAKINESGISVLSSGRLVKPAGELKLIGLDPYGMAVANNEKTAVILHNNAISVVDLSTSQMRVERFPSCDGKNKDVVKGSPFIGVCFSNDNRRVFLSGGDKGKVWVFDVVDRRLVNSFDLNFVHVESNKEAFATDLICDWRNASLKIRVISACLPQTTSTKGEMGSLGHCAFIGRYYAIEIF